MNRRRNHDLLACDRVQRSTNSPTKPTHLERGSYLTEDVGKDHTANFKLTKSGRNIYNPSVKNKNGKR